MASDQLVACRVTIFGPFRAEKFIGGAVPKALPWAEGGRAVGAGEAEGSFLQPRGRARFHPCPFFHPNESRTGWNPSFPA